MVAAGRLTTPIAAGPRKSSKPARGWDRNRERWDCTGGIQRYTKSPRVPWSGAQWEIFQQSVTDSGEWRIDTRKPAMPMPQFHRQRSGNRPNTGLFHISIWNQSAGGIRCFPGNSMNFLTRMSHAFHSNRKPAFAGSCSPRIAEFRTLIEYVNLFIFRQLIQL